MKKTKSKLKLLRKIAISAAVMVSNDFSVFALAPVEEASYPRAAVSSSSSPDRPVDRLQLMEQQINNLVNMNFSQQLSEQEQKIAALRGQLEEASHEIELLKKDLNDMKETKGNSLSSINEAESRSSPPLSRRGKAKESPGVLDETAYQKAIQAFSQEDYKKAKQAFLNYLQSYPHPAYEGEAHYWLGEIYLATKEFSKAATEFQKVINKYANLSLVPQAKLKLAMAHLSLGKVEQAKKELLAIKKSNPRSTLAELADVQLLQLEK